MANKKKNIPKDLLEEAIITSRGIVSDVIRYLAKNGYNASRECVNEYIDIHFLRELLEDQRMNATEDAIGRLYDKIEEGDNFCINLLLSTHGDKVGFIPNRAVKEYDHKKKVELQERQNERDREGLEEYRDLIEQTKKYPYQD